MARSLVDDRALALVVDIDLLRTQLGQWQTVPTSQLVARDLAVTLIAAQLSTGRDVVVPQFLGRAEFAEQLESIALEADGTFVEVLLDLDVESALERFRFRRSRPDCQPHPEADVDDGNVESMMVAASQALQDIARKRTYLRLEASGTTDEMHQVLASLLDPAR